VSWQGVLDAIDAVESWIVSQSYWVQVLLLLAVLGPLCWAAAGLIDRAVDAVLAWHSKRDGRISALPAVEADPALADPVASTGDAAVSVRSAPSAGAHS
jgi:hypothetical protein